MQGKSENAIYRLIECGLRSDDLYALIRLLLARAMQIARHVREHQLRDVFCKGVSESALDALS